MKLPAKYRKFENPITTIEQAKEFFREAGCSHFYMAHDFGQRYDEYRKLNISKQIEEEWRKESFYEIYSEILSKTSNDSLGSLHSDIYHLYAGLRTPKELIKILEITRYIHDKLPANDRVLVAETINGVRTIREARTGLIYMAYDTGNIEAAEEFIELSLDLSMYEKGKGQYKERYDESARRSKEIKL